ncbi:helix-turn-helix domain containing protein [Amycolatopsis sp. NPDC059021]|uniref:helix-turn-helix domain containing protein n=1 Tax=Amycolatopsis sp. NPDC059021 TaxID=3346704 RepID=UPI00366C73CA
MTIIDEHRTEVRQGNTTYQIAVATRSGDRAEPRVTITVGATGPEGEQVADGRLELDVEAVPAVADLLATSLHAFGGAGGPPRRRVRDRPARQGRPWSDEQDAELENRWLAGESVEDIARHFERTPGGIRARLPRVGCDPERPGEYLPAPPSRRAEPDGGAMD